MNDPIIAKGVHAVNHFSHNQFKGHKKLMNVLNMTLCQM